MSYSTHLWQCPISDVVIIIGDLNAIFGYVTGSQVLPDHSNISESSVDFTNALRFTTGGKCFEHEAFHNVSLQRDHYDR